MCIKKLCDVYLDFVGIMLWYCEYIFFMVFFLFELMILWNVIFIKFGNCVFGMWIDFFVNVKVFCID